MTGKREYVRQVVAYANYFKDFRKTLPRNVLQKMYQIFIYIMTLEKYLKSVTGVQGLFEIRIEESSNIYRVFCCMDDGNLVILFNGFQKKTQKTPLAEIERAKRIMNEYFSEKKRKEG